jgi:lipopolysaccharide transport system permease protein
VKESNHSLKLSRISSSKKLFELNFIEIYNYRDLLILFIKRDIVVNYKQTILGPLWLVIQPVFSALIYMLVFNRFAGIPTAGLPPIIFYLSGITFWNYFADSLKLTSDTFVRNAGIFGKVYFPRFIMPLSVVCSNVIRFAIQFLIFIVFYSYYYSIGSVVPNYTIVFVPFYLVLVAIMALGFGLLISALTTKYRDLSYLLSFVLQLWMYITPVIYSIEIIPLKYQWIVKYNPVTPLLNAFKYGFTGKPALNTDGIIYSLLFSAIIFFLGLLIFNRTEKNFMDTV